MDLLVVLQPGFEDFVIPERLRAEVGDARGVEQPTRLIEVADLGDPLGQFLRFDLVLDLFLQAGGLATDERIQPLGRDYRCFRCLLLSSYQFLLGN